MNPDLRITIVIVDYNYGRFLAAAIDSALAQTWSNTEVIVVDDGSTDDSATVIAGYGDRIKAFRKENGGQASVYNFVFPHTTGQLILFLDADDVLYPHCAATMAADWYPGVAKIQARLDTIDAEGRNLDLPFPYYAPDLSPAEIRRRCLSFGNYPWVVASGNAFDRDFVAQGLPVSGLFRNIADGYLSKIAPFYGDVVAVQDIVGGYRVHGGNHWAQSAATGSKYARATRYERDMAVAFMAVANRLGHPIDPLRLQLNKNHLESRLLSLRLSRTEHPIPQDSVWTIVRLGLRTAWVSPELSVAGRLLWTAWFPVVGFLPLPFVRHLVRRFRMQDTRAPVALKLIAWSRTKIARSPKPSPADSSRTSPGPHRVSIVVINHNYGRFLREAIDSALAQSRPGIEVIVVDDGSTDDSRNIIDAFGERIKIVLQPNGGHTSAVNAGFAESTGDIVIFLDADDRLHRDCVATVLAAWRDDAAKVQYRLATIDRDGRDLALPFPHYAQRLRRDPVEARRQLLRTGTYTYPVSSGNAFSRAFLARVMPIDPDFRRAPDGLLNRLAPLHGQVVALTETLADYRVHGANVLAQEHLDPRKFASNIQYEIEREAYFRERARGLGCALDGDILLKSKSHIETRLLSLRLSAGEHPVPTDSARSLAWQGIKSVFAARDLRVVGRLVWILWFLALAGLPAGAVAALARNLRLQSRRAPVANVLISLSRLATLLLFCRLLGSP